MAIFVFCILENTIKNYVLLTQETKIAPRDQSAKQKLTLGTGQYLPLGLVPRVEKEYKL